MNAPSPSRKELLRDRDGGLCWLCQAPMDFTAEGNSPRAATIEHLIPQCRDGPNTLDNLALCHTPCNRLLDNLPLAEKIRLRDQRQKERWTRAMRKRLAALLIP